MPKNLSIVNCEIFFASFEAESSEIEFEVNSDYRESILFTNKSALVFSESECRELIDEERLLTATRFPHEFS